MNAKVDTYSNLFDELLANEYSKNIPESELEELVSNLFNNFTESHSKALTSVLLKGISSESKKTRQMDSKFEQRNYKRWKKGFDLIHLLLDVSLQIGECGKVEVGIQNSKGIFYRLQAAVYLHARGLLVSREIFSLMKSGFPDGALGRWRTLHELAVINCFISANSEEVAQRFFEARIINSRKAAKQYVEHQDIANLIPFGQKELDEIEVEYQRVINNFGHEMKNDYGWAAPAIGHDRPTFFDLEKSINLDHWRPRYKWASQDTHGNFRPIEKTLAMTEATEKMLLVGPSNSGMTDPGQMLCISLGLLTSPFLTLDPTVDITILYKSFQILLNKVSIFFEIGNDKSK